MSDFRGPTVNPPDLDDVLGALRNHIFAYLNCHEIGKISKVTKSEQTVEVELQVKRRVNDTEIKSYPVLVDVPFFVLQGGGAFLDLPIEKGDTCIVLFNDRDTENWWIGETVKEPKTTRKHSLSDGIAIIGINSKNNALNLDGTKVVLNASGKSVQIKGSDLNLLEGTDFAVRFNQLQIAFNLLLTSHNDLVDKVNNHVHSGVTTGSSDTGNWDQTALQSSADISTAKSEKITLPGVGE